MTQSVEEFRKGGMSDTDMLEAALAWAHKQKLTQGAPAGSSVWQQCEQAAAEAAAAERHQHVAGSRCGSCTNKLLHVDRFKAA